MAFLSLLDDRAKPKGSRDPLGFELVWTHFGRKVIGNLTTITSSLNNFAVAILGFHWANELHAHFPKAEKQARIRETFLCYEQLAGYLRFLADDKEIMGITRVSNRMGDSTLKISMGMGAEQQILSDQASYGLWGLYSAAMKESGLILGDERTPTALGESIAQLIEKELDKAALLDLLSGNKVLSHDVLTAHAKPFLAAIRNSQIQELLLHALMKGNDRHAVQQELWRVTQALAEAEVPVEDLPAFIRAVKGRTNIAQLERRLTDIEYIERILVAANNIFHYCRRKDGESLENILDALAQRYSYVHLPTDIDLSDVPRADLILAIRNALQKNDTAEAIRKILELNRVVMGQRGGAPWVELESDNTLRVRVQSETAALRDQNDLESSWDYEYFLTSFTRIATKALGTQWTAR